MLESLHVALTPRRSPGLLQWEGQTGRGDADHRGWDQIADIYTGGIAKRERHVLQRRRHVRRPPEIDHEKGFHLVTVVSAPVSAQERAALPSEVVAKIEGGYNTPVINVQASLPGASPGGSEPEIDAASGGA